MGTSLYAAYHLGMLLDPRLGFVCLAIAVALVTGVASWDLSKGRD